MESPSGSEGSKPSEPPEGGTSQNVKDEKPEAKTLKEQKDELEKLKVQKERLKEEEEMEDIERRRKNKKFEQQDLKLPENPAPVKAPEVPSELTQMSTIPPLSEEDIKKNISSLWTTKEGSPQPVCTVDANAVVANASGEHLQRGMKLEGGVWKQCSSTRLLEPATGVKLVQPSCALPAGESTFEFFSSESLDKFSALSIQGSFSVAGMFSAFGFALSAKRDFGSGKSKQSMQQSSESVYAKSTVHTVPTAACLLECSNLHLSGRAIEELKNIEAMMTCKSDVTEEATKFFDQYGSHAIAGMIHFGGVHITTAHALYQSSSNLEMIKNSVSEALAAAVKGGNLFFKCEASVGLSSSSEDNTAVKREKQSSNVQLKSQMIGGAPGASSVYKWFEGLVQDSSTWAVIDGSSATVPVWQIVKANGQHFQDADALANALKKSWEEHTGQKAPAEISDSYRQAVSCVQQCIDEFAQRVKNENLSEENWQLQLQNLCEKVEAVEQLTDEEKRGVSWTQSPLFHAIMLAVVKVLPTIRGDAIKPIKSHISYLLEMSGSCSFPMKGRLHFQLACEQENKKYSKLSEMGLDCPLKLAEAVEQTVLPDLQAFNVQHEGDSEKQRQVLQLVFVDLNTAVQHLLRRLKESGDVEQRFLTCTALARNSYSLQNDIFEKLMNPESLQHLAQNLKESAQQFAVIKESCEPEFVQARLLHTAMEARFDDGCCFQVADWILLFQQCGIQWIALLNEKLTDIAYNSSKAWKELNEVVTHLLSNFSDNGQTLQLPENMVSKLRDARSSTSEVVVPSSDKQQFDKDGMALIQRLGLAEYFPSKIGLIDVTKVGGEMYSAATDVTQLPQKILKSIIQADYKSGFEIVEACNISPSEGKKAVSQSFWDDEDDQEDMAHEAKKLHYSDVLLACLLSCNMRLQQLLAEKLNDCKHAFPIASACAGSLELRVWSLRSCCFVHPDPQQGGKVLRISSDVDKFPIISFVRLGNSQFSKSSIINKCISDKHELFPEFNSNSPSRTISDGSIELAWAVPDPQNESLGLQQVTCVLNLRGDGLLHQEQLKLLSSLSACVVVMLPESDAETDSVLTALYGIMEWRRSIVLVRTSEKVPQCMKKAKKELDAMGGLFQGITCWSKKDQMSPKSIACEMKKVFSKLDLKMKRSLDKISAIGEFLEWQVDENQPVAQQALSAAQTVMQFIDEKEDLAVSRNKNLPLSGSMWQTIAKRNKNLYRENKRMDSNKRAKWVEAERDEIRKGRQRLFLFLKEHGEANSFLFEFMMYASKATDDSCREIFMQRMKLSLDSLCRRKLPQLTSNYQQALVRNREAQNKTLNVKSCNDELVKLEKKMEDSAFGLEQVFREIGQTYEAIHQCCGSQVASAQSDYKSMLTSFAADLLLKGEPLEVMDGNASACPVDWVSAVLEAVEKKVGKKSLLVLAVVGLQSSGKSTLLNSLFGLQLAVSAGRCTKGAFLQLVPNDKQKSQLNADYIAVIDSEGLRSSEIAEGSMTHDNELATMIIGLADVTIMNMYGEGLTDTRDILQVVVHAFLRMKAAFGDIIKKKSCIFVHQNVAAVNAAEETRVAKEKLLTKLDQSTRDVAEEEQQLEVTRFTDVIDFADSNIFFLPHLWEGKPPMAPVSPDYCKDVMKVKRRVIDTLKCLSDSNLSFSELSQRIKDLWNAVLKEDFVFSFQNTIELQAYRDVEQKFAELKMMIEKAASDWLCSNITLISGSSSSEKLENNFRDAENKMRTHIFGVAQTVSKEMTEFICSHRKKEICKKWQQERENALRDAADKAISETHSSLMRSKEIQRVKLLNQNDMGKYREEILERAKRLANEKQGKEMSDQQLDVQFKEMWSRFMSEVRLEKSDVWDGENILKSVLDENFYDQGPLLNKEWDAGHAVPFAGQRISGSFPLMRVEKDDFSHVTGWKKFWKEIKKSFGYETAEGYVHSECNEILKEADEVLDQSETLEPKVHLRLALTQIVSSIRDGVSRFNSSDTEGKKPKVSLTPNLNVKLSVHAGRSAEMILRKRQVEFDARHGLKAQLESFKETAFTYFKSMYKKESEEVMAANFIASSIKQAAIVQVRQLVANRVTLDIESQFSGMKLGLIKAILRDLADREPFQEFQAYLHNSKQFAESWLEAKMKYYLLKKDDETKRTRLRNLIKDNAGVLIGNVEKDIRDAADSVHSTNAQNAVTGCSLGTLVHVFCEGQRTLGITPDDFEQISQLSVAKLSDFIRVLKTKINDLTEQIETQLDVPLEEFDWGEKSPHLCACEKLWGCLEQCPLCDEPCTNMTGCASGNKHCCMQHRIHGVRGSIVETTDGKQTGVSLGTCGYYVAENRGFFCSSRCKKTGRCEPYAKQDKDRKYHYFSDINKIIRGWNILPDQGKHRKYHYYSDINKIFLGWNILPDQAMDKCDYWKWFLVTFKEELKNYYNWKVCDIPDYGVTKTQAIESLDKLYKG